MQEKKWVSKCLPFNTHLYELELFSTCKANIFTT